MIKQISILAYTCSDNVGDNAILEGILHELREKIGECEVFILDFGFHGPELLVPEGVRIRRMSPYNIASLALHIFKSKYVILGGGGIIQKTSSIYNLIYFLILGGLAVAVGRPLHIRAVGIECMEDTVLRRPLSWLARKASSISVRDNDSRDRLEKITGYEVAIDVEKDPAFARPYHRSRVRSEVINATEVPYVLAAIRSKSGGKKWLTASSRNSPGNLKRQAEYIAPLLEKILEAALQGAEASQIVFVPCQSPRDELFSCYVLERFNHLSGKILAGPINFDELLYLCRHSSGVCSARYHACIAALRADVPLLAFSNAKIESLLKESSPDGRSLLVSEFLDVRFDQVRDFFEKNH